MSSNINEKRELVNLIFSNLKLINGELQFSLRSPFDKLVNLASYNIWGERWGWRKKTHPANVFSTTGEDLLNLRTNDSAETQVLQIE